MDRHWIMDPTGDASSGKGLQHLVPSLKANRINVINMNAVRRRRRRNHAVETAEQLIIMASMFASGGISRPQMLELDSQRSRLNPIHPGVPAHHGVMVLLA